MMKSYLQRFSVGIAKTMRSIDMFGKHITLTYNSEDQFKTHFGGVCTLICKI